MLRQAAQQKAQQLHADPRLAALVTAWPTLSESARRVIEEIIGTAKE